MSLHSPMSLVRELIYQPNLAAWLWMGMLAFPVLMLADQPSVKSDGVVSIQLKRSTSAVKPVESSGGTVNEATAAARAPESNTTNDISTDRLLLDAATPGLQLIAPSGDHIGSTPSGAMVADQGPVPAANSNIYRKTLSDTLDSTVRLKRFPPPSAAVGSPPAAAGPLYASQFDSARTMPETLTPQGKPTLQASETADSASQVHILNEYFLMDAAATPSKFTSDQWAGFETESDVNSDTVVDDANDPESSDWQLDTGTDSIADQPSEFAADRSRGESNEIQASDGRESTQECPGGEVDCSGAVAHLPTQPDDVPLEQEEHPFDAPAAKATKTERRLETAGRSNAVGFSDAELEMMRRIDQCLDYFRTHPENIVRRGPWALMHTILPFGVESEVLAGKQRANTIGWLCHNGVCARQRMFQPTRSGFRPNIGPGVQGHEGQFLAILAQSHVQPDYPLQIGNRRYTVMDLVQYEKATCREKSELTFKLIAFAHYLDPNDVWRDNRGQRWNIEKLVAEELAQPVNGAACGGTHRLMGLSCAVNRRQEAGLSITGHFARAEKFLDDFIAYTLTLQNPDGGFSTEWFERRADEPNVDRKIQTTGHILEWLVYTMPDEHLRSPEIQRAVNFLLDSIGENPQRDWPIGPRGHSLRALALYRKRVFKDHQPPRLTVDRPAPSKR
ncbi:MAG: hypothetical protein KF752_20395 [Pirellulaceae bacterium]|nr:hypothetical protein [Pirellulaceae bacterium]